MYKTWFTLNQMSPLFCIDVAVLILFLLPVVIFFWILCV